MVESIFTLLMTSPVLSISLGFALAVILVILFRKVIERYLIKKFELYNVEQVKGAVDKAVLTNTIEGNEEECINHNEKESLSEQVVGFLEKD